MYSTGICSLQVVTHRRKDTLEGIIKEITLPKSHIISNGWISYAAIERIDISYIFAKFLFAIGQQFEIQQ